MTTEHEPMSEQELAEAKALCDAATPGPWRVNPEFHDPPDSSVDIQAAVLAPDEAVIDYCWYDGPHVIVRPRDSAFIAASRELVPRLIAEVERLQKQRREDFCEIEDLHEALGEPSTQARSWVREMRDERDALRAEVEKRGDHLRAALADVAEWKRRWSEVAPAGPDADLALYAAGAVAERDALRTEADRMRPVFEAAKRERGNLISCDGRFRGLVAALDAALASAPRPGTR